MSYKQKLHKYNNHNNNKVKKDVYIGEDIEFNLKTELLNYLYMNIDFYQLRYSILRTVEHAQQLKNQTYNVSAHFHGYNYFLIFKKLSDNKMGVYIVYRMDLKFNRKDINDKYVKIYKLNINDDSLDQYNNTVIDGKIVLKKEQKYYLISDILYYKGSKYFNVKIDEKFKMIDDEIPIFKNSLLSYFDIKLIRLYKYSEMTELVYNKICKTDFKINGIVFIPMRSGRTYIYLNDAEFETIKKSDNSNEINSINNIKLINNNSEIKTLLLQKTQTIDVYDVFDIDKTVRFGICCIPTIEISYFLRSYFQDNNQLIIDCQFDNKFSKWKPII